MVAQACALLRLQNEVLREEMRLELDALQSAEVEARALQLVAQEQRTKQIDELAAALLDEVEERKRARLPLPPRRERSRSDRPRALLAPPPLCPTARRAAKGGGDSLPDAFFREEYALNAARANRERSFFTPPKS